MSYFQTGRSVATMRQIEAIKKAFAERDAEWWETIHVLLATAPRTSRDLVLAIGRQTYGEGARTVAWLRKMERAGRIVRAGIRRGPTGHPNVLWVLP